MIRAVLDTNVFVSALNFGGTPNEVLKLLEADAFVLCISQSIINEIRRIMLARFEWSEEDLADVLDPLFLLADDIAEPNSRLNVSRDPDDNHVLACAIDASADVIVTGDDDLLSLNAYRVVKVITPRAFIELLERQ